MPTVIYIKHDGSEHEVHVEKGTSVMQAAVDNMVDGILGDCGGACSCATCHCYVSEEWQDKIPAADVVEQEMLDFVMDPKDNSRLSCQIIVTDELDGLKIHLPKSQF